MIVIWGSKIKERRIKDGYFHCPQCHGQAPFVHRQLSNYFTLYFIPLFSTANLGEYVQCEQCSGKFSPDVLALDPEQIEELLTFWTCEAGNRVLPFIVRATAWCEQVSTPSCCALMPAAVPAPPAGRGWESR